MEGGPKNFSSLTATQAKLLKGYFDLKGIPYAENSTTTTTTMVVGSAGMGAVPITSEVSETKYNITITQ